MVQDIIRKSVTQLVKKYPAFLWNPKVHYRVHKSPPLDPILSKANPVRPIDSYLPKVHLNIILPHSLISSGPGRFETFHNNKNFYGEGLLAPRPNLKLEDHPFSALRIRLFNIFAATLQLSEYSAGLRAGRSGF
jgi:hypothetical protein